MPDISKLIADFISISDSVIIPGFGKISKEYQSARLDRIADKISPPHFLLNFDHSIQEDKSDNLLHYISKTETLSFEVAAELLQQYKKELLSHIFEGKSSNIPGIGSFYSESDVIKFIPIDFNLAAKTIDAIPIDRKFTQFVKIKKPKENKSKVLLYRLLISSVIVVSLVFLIFFLTNEKQTENASESGENNPAINKIDSTEKADSKEDTVLGPVIETEKSGTDVNAKSYLIAVGTYAGPENSAKIEKQLKADGYEVLTKMYKSGKVRVSVVVKGQISDLNKALKNIRMKYDKAAFVVE
jgi:nucleoid DNA-binding protein